MDDRYRGIYGTRDVILMNKKDIEKFGLDTSKAVTVFNNYDSVYREVTGLTIVPYDIPVSCVATYFPECKALIPLSETARKSNTPASKSIRVQIKNSASL